MKMVLYVCDLPPKNLQPQSNHEENTTQSQTEGQSMKYLTSTLQNCQDHQKQGKCEKLSQTSRSSGDMTTKGNAISWMGPENRKGH